MTKPTLVSSSAFNNCFMLCFFINCSRLIIAFPQCYYCMHHHYYELLFIIYNNLIIAQQKKKCSDAAAASSPSFFFSCRIKKKQLLLCYYYYFILLSNSDCKILAVYTVSNNLKKRLSRYPQINTFEI